jgi:hypothetical protein
MLTVRLGLLIGRITFFAFRQRATFHTAWTHSGHHGPLDTSFPLEDDYTLVA